MEGGKRQAKRQAITRNKNKKQNSSTLDNRKFFTISVKYQ